MNKPQIPPLCETCTGRWTSLNARPYVGDWVAQCANGHEWFFVADRPGDLALETPDQAIPRHRIVNQLDVIDNALQGIRDDLPKTRTPAQWTMVDQYVGRIVDAVIVASVELDRFGDSV